MFMLSPKELALFATHHRKKQNLSQTDVAKMAGLKQKTISAFENKPETVKVETLFKILYALKLEIHSYSKNEIQNNKEQDEW